MQYGDYFDRGRADAIYDNVWGEQRVPACQIPAQGGTDTDGVVVAKQRARCRRIGRTRIVGCAPQYIRGLPRDLLVLQRATGLEAWTRRFASMISLSVDIT
jgi:hypothetical protein